MKTIIDPAKKVYDKPFEITLDKVLHDIESQLLRYKEKMEEKR